MELDTKRLPRGIRVGTSSFSSSDWIGTFYPEGAKPADFLTHYARKLATVEVDATWYRIPSAAVVAGWSRKTPENFLFSFKVPRVITHEKELVDCDDDWNLFLERIDPLGSKLGPLLFQFPYVAKGKDAEEYRTGARFRERLADFLPLVPPDQSVVVEVRNGLWLDDSLVALLGEYDVSLALTDYFTMPRPGELFERIDPVTARFSYIRMLGHHKRMNKQVADAIGAGERQRDWESIIVDRTRETEQWCRIISELADRQEEIFVYFNNHYAGFAPGSINLFIEMWEKLLGGEQG